MLKLVIEPSRFNEVIYQGIFPKCEQGTSILLKALKKSYKIRLSVSKIYWVPRKSPVYVVSFVQTPKTFEKLTSMFIFGGSLM